MAYPLFAWNAEGHRVVAEIAWQYLTDEAKARFNPAHPILDKKNYPASFKDASVWFDSVRGNKNLSRMHYVDIPYLEAPHLQAAIKPKAYHGLMAYQKAREKLLYGESKSALEEVIALRIVLHLVADLHQPLHAATYITEKYPKGDLGGNKVKLPRNKVARNLHSYWDKAGGFLVSRSTTQEKAHALLKLWPCNVSDMDTNPVHWLAESHVYAETKVYSFTRTNFKNGRYQAVVYELSEQRLAEAGCRLAAVLNEIATFGQPVVT